MYCGSRALLVCRGTEALLTRRTADLDATLAGLTEWLAGQASGLVVDVWLGASQCRPLWIPAQPAIRGDAEWQALARAMAASRTGWPEVDPVWMSPARQGRARVAAALMPGLLAHVQQAVRAAGKRHRLRRLSPWWSAALSAALRREAGLRALAVSDDDALTLLTGEEDRFSSITSQAPLGAAEHGPSALQRLLLSADCPDEDVLTVRLGMDALRPPDGTGLPLGALAQWSR